MVVVRAATMEDWQVLRDIRLEAFSTGNASSVHLWLMETNRHAWVLYERCGFSATGERQRLQPNKDLSEIGMIRPL